MSTNDAVDRPGSSAEALPLDLRFVVLAGAPKCATTAIAQAMSEHSEVAFSVPKEPYWFGSDLAPMRERLGLRSWSDYGKTFPRRRRPEAAVLAEGTTLTLSSPDALLQIKQVRPDAKVVCAVRNPTELAHAFHSQMVYAGYEPDPSFEQAWRRGGPVDGASPVPRLLDYRDIGSVGSQLRAALEVFGREQIHVVVHDDVVRNPADALRGIARFIGIDPEPMVELPKVNTSAVVRSPTIGRVVRSRPMRAVADTIKRRSDSRAVAAAIRVKDAALRRPAPRAELARETRAEVDAAFTSEVALLEELLGRRLDAWRRRD